ncbi:MAG: Mrp/NBP35 family ATP-binding protein [Planctomycetota bacterium]
MNQPTPDTLLAALRAVQDPDLKQDIVSLGFVKDLSIHDGDVTFTLELTTPACPVREILKDQARKAAADVPGVKRVFLTVTSRVRPGTPAAGRAPIPGVKNIIAVASGKGGVGKSTVSANLAVALAKTGAATGLLDADIYGPSLPMLLGVHELPPTVGGRICPAVAHGVKLVSTGFFIKADDAVLWRGPMLGKMIQQLLADTDWGTLDYLITDLPPGTGDIPMSLCQTVPITGSVIVSTPQDAALAIARKAVTMFRTMECPVLGLVENMSYFLCPHCGSREEVFGHGGARQAAESLGISFLGEIPLATALRAASDAGTPPAADAARPLSVIFREIAGRVAAEASVAAAAGNVMPS